MNASDFEVQVSVTADRAPTGTSEPCESCGTHVVLAEMASIVDVFLGGKTPPGLRAMLARPSWLEAHADETPDSHLLTYRPHTPERCHRVRAGDPEPVDWDDETEDDS